MGLLSFLTGKRRTPLRDAVHLGSAAFNANPYPFYARLRAQSPIHRVGRFLGQEAWLVTRYDDASAVLKDERFVKEAANAMTPEQLAGQPWFRKVKVFQSLQHNMLNQDPPAHARLRTLVNAAFTPRLIGLMRERIQALADKLLDKVQDRGRMDVIRDYALPLPATIIAEMLGVPPADRHRFHRWSNAMIAISSSWGVLKAIPNVWALTRYIRKIIKMRRVDPQDDLVSALARAEDAGDRLSEDELVAMVALLLVAGHETTVNLIGNGTLTLLEHPAQMEQLRSNPALIKPALEELLRYSSPVATATERYAREDVTVAGINIPRGELVGVVLASANRDERQFPNPDSLDLTREPNRHLSFGVGNHFCLGASLARLEGQIAVNTLLRRFPDLRLAVTPGALRWRPGPLLRGLESLPVAFCSG